MIAPNPDSCIERTAQQAHIDGQSAPTKAGRLAEVLRRPEVWLLGVEFRLLVRLIMIEGGTLTGTYQEIGEAMRTDARNVRGWAAKLVEQHMIALAQKEHARIELRLLPPYWDAAAMSDAAPAATPAVSNSAPDPDQGRLLDLHAAARAAGAVMHVTVEGTFGDATTRRHR